MMLPFKDYGSLVYGIPKLQSGRFIITETQIRTLFSSPITILPAIPNIYHEIEFSHFYREAGTAYTLAGVTGALFQSNGANNSQWPSWPSDLLGVNGPSVEWWGGRSFGGGDRASVSRPVTQAQFGALTFLLTGADPTGGSGRIFLTLFWRDWMNAPLGASTN